MSTNRAPSEPTLKMTALSTQLLKVSSIKAPLAQVVTSQQEVAVQQASSPSLASTNALFLGVPILLGFLVGGGLVGWFSYFDNRRRNLREALFKCFDGYLKVMEYKSIALRSGLYDDYFNYFRALFDLQWSEYQLWKRRALADGPYSEWLKQRMKGFNEAPVIAKCADASEKKVGYAIVWGQLKSIGYYDADDPFRRHLDNVHKGNIAEAMKDKQSFWAAHFSASS